MIYTLEADGIVVFHFIFILFVIMGGLLVLKWEKCIWIHLPAAFWGALIEFTGWICPLTPLENELRIKGGTLGYSGGFIEHYLLPVIYPEGLTHQIQIILGSSVVIFNLFVYWLAFKKYKRKKKRPVHHKTGRPDTF